MDLSDGAFTRVYVGAHYPSDVVAGLALGAIVAGGGERLVTPLLTRMATWISGTRLRPLVTTSLGQPQQASRT